MSEPDDSDHVAPSADFRRTAEAARCITGIVAARARGDFAGAEQLLTSMDDHARAAGGVFLADLLIGLLAGYEDRAVADVARDLSVQVASVCA